MPEQDCDIGSMIEHLELLQESVSGHLTGAEFSRDGRAVRPRSVECKCPLVVQCCEGYRSKFMRLSESFPDLTGPQLKDLNKLCLDARRSEEFFLTDNATNQFLRTVIGHEKLDPRTWTEPNSWSNLIQRIVIHSNILPYDGPYWSKLLASRDVASKGLHFPSWMRKGALKTELLERKCAGGEREHGGGRSEDGDCARKVFREVQAADVTFVEQLAEGSDGVIKKITWRGGTFVLKERTKLQSSSFDAELEVVKRFCHPHIVYSFGSQPREGFLSSYFMEYMTYELFIFIINRVERVVADGQPPFSPRDSVDVLSQIAKAMRYMHRENVVHCDLKSKNILISEIATPDNAPHYLVKVADFGSARLVVVDSSSGSAGEFLPGASTTNYSAPEVLRNRNKPICTNSPHKIDVYSFGIVAFEVLTGKNNFEQCSSSPSEFKRGVMDGSVRPRLREECQENKAFTQDEDLISLIERCWGGDPLKRPSFVEICQDLEKASVRISETLHNDHPKCQASSFSRFKFFQGNQK